MNISYCTKKIVLFLLIASTATGQTIVADDIPSDQPETEQNTQATKLEDLNLSPEEIEIMKSQLSQVSQLMDNLVTRIIATTVQIEGLLEELSHAANNNAFGKENKEKLLEQIKAIRLIINQVKSSAFVNVDPVALHRLVRFNELLMDHISESIKNGFKKLPPFQEKLIQLYSRDISEIDFEKIEERLEKNQKRLFELVKDANQIGLTWYNKLTRKMSAYMFTAQKKGWTKKLKHMLVLGGISTHIIMKYTNMFYTPEQLDFIEAIKDEDYYKNSNYHTQSFMNHRGKTPEERRDILLGKTEYQGNAFTRCGRFFRNKIIGAPVLYNHKGRPTRGMLTAEYDRYAVGSMGKVDAAISSVVPVVLATYAPAMTIAYGASWGTDLAGWIRKKITTAYGTLTGGVAGKQIINSQEDTFGSRDPRFTFDDVVGLDHIKNTLKRILEYLKDPERFDRAGIVPEQGYLFTGAPGTGKSFVAEAFGGEIRKLFKEMGRAKDEFGFYYFDTKDMNSLGIREILDFLKREAPCIVFIDEIDLLSLQRGQDNKVLGEFLSAMSGVLSKDSGKQIILIAATNRPEHLDKALRRRGRFGKVIHFELPTVLERKNFLVEKLNPLLPDLSVLDLEKLAQETEGRTYQELEAMVNTAFQNAKEMAQPVTQDHLEEALDEEIRNIMIRKEMNISSKEQQLIAAHLTGHALAAELLQPRRKLSCVTMLPITEKLPDEFVFDQYGKKREKDVVYGKLFTKCSFDHLEMLTKEEKIKECKTLLAGMVAERLLLGSCGYSYHPDDRQKALNIVKSIVFEGLYVKTMPKEVHLQYFETALKTLQQYEDEIEELLKNNKITLERMAQELKEYKTLSAERVKLIVAESTTVNVDPSLVPASV